jgi:uncharacterized small protein (DUF1192 family)
MADDDAASNRFELASGLTLAVLAALTAVNDLGGGKFGDDEIVGHNEKASAYAWYQSKSIKETSIAQEAELLQALADAGAIVESARPAVEQRIAGLQVEVKRYKAEKKEILQGSTAVGPEGQVLEKDGQKGKIVGAQEWEKSLEILGEAGDRFDDATLWLQLSMVAGAISLVIKSVRLKWSFYAGMVLMGVVGAGYTALAWQIAGAL